MVVSNWLTAFLLAALAQTSMLADDVRSQQPASASPIPAFYEEEPDCRVKSIEQLRTVFEGGAKSPLTDNLIVSKPGARGIYQAYLVQPGREDRCLTCTKIPNGPPIERNKMMITWHPSGQWFVIGIEEDKHDNMWMPKSWQLGLIQSGIWLNMWIANEKADRWYQVTDFQNGKSKNGPSNGFVGTPFTPDGKKAVWAEIIDGNIFANHFGRWRLFSADFNVAVDGSPSLTNKKDITPAGARWVEPGNFSKDGKHILLSTDIGLKDAQGQDQWSLDISTGLLHQLTKTPQVWDEHGLYSPNGKKVAFMSSLPYRKESNSYQTNHLKTEFMMMDADGSHLQQLTHFNVPGYPESQSKRTIAAVAAFSNKEGSQLFGTVMGPNFSKTNWVLTFAGACGGH